jgi:hypothetical protein
MLANQDELYLLLSYFISMNQKKQIQLLVRLGFRRFFCNPVSSTEIQSGTVMLI